MVRTLLLCATSVLCASPAAGQTDQGPSPARYRFALVGGASGIGSGGTHVFGGFEGARMGARFGAVSLAQGGDGNGFTSRLLAAGPGVQLLRGDRIDLVAFAGPGHYGEILLSGDGRSSWVTTGGLSARLPLRSVPAAVSLVGWRGRFRGDGFASPVRVRGFRIAIGVGWGWSS